MRGFGWLFLLSSSRSTSRERGKTQAQTSFFEKMIADRDISAQEAVHLLLVDCSRMRTFVILNTHVGAPLVVLRDEVAFDDRAFERSFFKSYQTRPDSTLKGVLVGRFSPSVPPLADRTPSRRIRPDALPFLSDSVRQTSSCVRGHDCLPCPQRTTLASADPASPGQAVPNTRRPGGSTRGRLR
jgi:hypothetical protein